MGIHSRAGLELDVATFREGLMACRTHSYPPDHICPDCVPLLAAAIELYQDDFLAGFTLPDSLAFDEWQRHQTEALRDEFASVLERLSACYAAQGEYKPAISAAQRWLGLDPLREAAHRRLMELFAQAGRGGATLRQYRACVRVLEQELGVPPSAQTTALLQIGTIAGAFRRLFASHGGGPVQLNTMACLPNALYLEAGLIKPGSPLRLVDGETLVPRGPGFSWD